MKFEFSAGGIVFKKEGSNLLILVSQHSQHKAWVFPKGLIGDREDNKREKKEETAIREVKEETGVDAEILKPITPITFWYVWPRGAGSHTNGNSSGKGEKRKKTVYYFIMKYIGGDITKHDDEMQAVEWLPEDEVLERLTYKGDKDSYKEALPLIKTLANS